MNFKGFSQHPNDSKYIVFHGESIGFSNLEIHTGRNIQKGDEGRAFLLLRTDYPENISLRVTPDGKGIVIDVYGESEVDCLVECLEYAVNFLKSQSEWSPFIE